MSGAFAEIALLLLFFFIDLGAKLEMATLGAEVVPALLYPVRNAVDDVAEQIGRWVSSGPGEAGARAPRDAGP
jgi:hypothetical protein